MLFILQVLRELTLPLLLILRYLAQEWILKFRGKLS